MFIFCLARMHACVHVASKVVQHLHMARHICVPWNSCICPFLLWKPCLQNNNNYNKNWNPVLSSWRRPLQFHHYLDFVMQNSDLLKFVLFFLLLGVILMYVLTCEKLSLRKWLKSVWVQWVFLFSSSSFLHSPMDWVHQFCRHLLEFTTFHDGHMMDYYYYYSKF